MVFNAFDDPAIVNPIAIGGESLVHNGGITAELGSQGEGRVTGEIYCIYCTMLPSFREVGLLERATGA